TSFRKMDLSTPRSSTISSRTQSICISWLQVLSVSRRSSPQSPSLISSSRLLLLLLVSLASKTCPSISRHRL
ncbi:hypothetical protein DXG01_000713, partial [Tephrocybe rancida]